MRRRSQSGAMRRSARRGRGGLKGRRSSPDWLDEKIAAGATRATRCTVIVQRTATRHLGWPTGVGAAQKALEDEAFIAWHMPCCRLAEDRQRGPPMFADTV